MASGTAANVYYVPQFFNTYNQRFAKVLVEESLRVEREAYFLGKQADGEVELIVVCGLTGNRQFALDDQLTALPLAAVAGIATLL